ncbi:hypothetical protein [Streptomyces sp. NPDC014764]|uniref:hypothetical protein n=1 Tax=Streptomyces sp. NPDC014764 TaxID=3364907 RepID=UPI0036F9C176
MAAEQLPDGVREFTDHLRGLLARLDRYAGWCLVFWQRDPEGMRACLEGREPPPWDVVESLLQDLAVVHGPEAAEAELPRARSLHAQATAAFDARPGARQTLSDRLDVMLREQRYAADRRADLTRRLAAAANREEAEALGNDLAWAEDDHRRATARCAELTARTTALDDQARAASPAHTQGRFATRRTPDAGSPKLWGARPTPADLGRPSARPSRNPSPSAPAQGPALADGGLGPSPSAPAHGSPRPRPAPQAADHRTTAPAEAQPSPHAPGRDPPPGTTDTPHPPTPSRPNCARRSSTYPRPRPPRGHAPHRPASGVAVAPGSPGWRTTGWQPSSLRPPPCPSFPPPPPPAARGSRGPPRRRRPRSGPRRGGPTRRTSTRSPTSCGP